MNGLRMLRAALDRDSRSIALALALLIAALVMPRVELPRDAYEYVVVFDISQSMNVEDYELAGAPVSRLAYARVAARRALQDLPCGSRVGWAAFTGYRTVLLLAPVEVCDHYGDLLASLEKIDGRMRWSNASEITKGLYWSVMTAQETSGQPDVVFLSDGQEAPPLDPAYPPRVLEDIRDAPIRGWLIGTGSLAPSPIPRIDEQGRRQGYWRADEVVQSADWRDDPRGSVGEHLSGLREAHLRTLAEELRFEYTRLSDAASLSAAMRDERFSRRRAAPTDLSGLPAALALLLLAIRFWPDKRRRPRQDRLRILA